MMKMPDKKSDIKFLIIFYAFCLLCIALMVTNYSVFEYVEFDLAIDWVYKYFCLPILLVMAPTSYYIYFTYIIKREKKQYTSKLSTNLRSILRIVTLTFGMSLICCGVAMGLIFLTNAFPSGGRPIMIHDEIVDSYSSYNRGKTSYFIKILDKRFNRPIKLEVEEGYHVGDTFTKKMEIGRWGLLYKVRD